MTDSVGLTADNFYIKIGRTAYTAANSNLSLHSNPGTTYKTLEAIWQEFNPELNDIVEMRMFIYFKSDGVYWWSDEIRTYNGNKNGDWIYYRPSDPNKPFFKTLNGSTFIQNGEMALPSSPLGQGTIYFNNLRINPFFPSVCFSNMVDTDSATKAYALWVSYGRPKMPGCQPCIPIAYPDRIDATIKLEPNAYYCEPTPIVSPSESCIGKPNGTKCESVSCPNCPPGNHCIMLACLPYAGVCQNQQCVRLASPQSPTPIRTTPSTCPQLVPPAPNSGCVIRQPGNCTTPSGCCPIIVCPTITRPPIGTPIPTNGTRPCPTAKEGCTMSPSPASCPPNSTIPCCGTEICPITQKQTINIQFRYASIPDARVTNGFVKIGIVTPTTELWTPSLKVQPLGTTGIYQASFTLPQALDRTKLYRFIIKGEKHIASKICRLAGQNQACGVNEWITVPVATNFTISYVNRPIEPGDVVPQDNVTNKADFTRVIQAAAKLSSKQTDQDKLVGDLDYNNVVDLTDIGLMRKSLETRPDEN